MVELALEEPAARHEQRAMAYRQEFLSFGETRIQGSCDLIRYTDYLEWLAAVARARKVETSPLGVAATTYFSVHQGDGRIIGTVQPVSYTHLDVYKRQLVRRQGEQVNAQFLYINWYMANRLHRVGMKNNPVFVCNSGNLLNRLDCPDLVVCKHDRNENRVVPDCIFQIGKADHSVLVNR